MTPGLQINTFNRPEYLAECLASVKAADLRGVKVIIVDDCSTDRETLQLIKKSGFKTYSAARNGGIKESLKLGYSKLLEAGCDILINLDGDAIVKKDFIKVLLKLKKQFKHIVSGFNTDSKANPIIEQGEGYVFKRDCNGINMVIDREEYYKYVLYALDGPGNWDFVASRFDPLPKVISRPSVIQHIGFKSSMGHQGADVACDFKRISLPSVTLFGIDARDQAGIIKAGKISQQEIEFGASVIITERLFSGHAAYSEFCIKRMVDYIKTDHMLIIHADGYVLNPKAWKDEWLQYDYIGAPWPYADGMAVGNGGFCLRSRRLMQILKDADIEHIHPEDHHICRTYRTSLEKDHGIKFAPESVAREFSIEAYGSKDRKYKGQFGFHGGNIDFIGADIPHIPYTKAAIMPTESAKDRALALWAARKKKFSRKGSGY